MSIRNLDHLFRPASIALIGASKRSSSVGAVLARNLFSAGFDGPVMPVNPKHDAVEGVLAYRDVASLPVTPDLAVISTPPDSVPGIVADLAARGTRAAVVITAGFGESRDAHGRELQQALLDAARPHLLRVVGPNCVGIMVPGRKINATFSHIAADPGPLAFVTQSGAIVTSVLDFAQSRGVGFSHIVSLGDMADVDFGDMLDYLANDAETRAILLYVEAVTHARKFMSAARAAARTKPVIVVKAGRHAEGARAAASHTGSLAGSDAVYDAAFRRAGMLRVMSLEELFDAVAILGTTRHPRGDRIAILTNGGGIGVLATDAAIDEGARLAELSSATVSGLDRVLPPTWSRGNPVDIIGDAPASRYRAALEILLDDPDLDGALVLNCPTALVSSTDAARAVIETSLAKNGPPVLTSWIGDRAAAEPRRMFAAHGIPTYETPEQAVRAFMYMVNYRRSQAELMETPPSIPAEFTPEPERVRAVVQRALEEQRSWLSEPEAKEVLAAYDVPVAPTKIARDPGQVAELAAEFGGPVALKILSPDITHKTDVGGVALDLAGPTAARSAAEAMSRRVAEALPGARLAGFSVSPMVRRPGAFELIVGATLDAQFGPVILFGQGGTGVEVIGDRALALPPLNMRLARELIARTRIHGLLRGFRGGRAVNLDALALTLIRVAQLVVDFPQIVELDVNPLLSDEYGVVALDARIRVQPAAGPATERLAIRPYPKELERAVVLGDSRELLLRPIVPEDEPSLQRHFASLSPEEVRLRFLAPVKTLSHMMAARFTQLDYDREMAFILTERGIPGKTEIYGVVRIFADPDNERAEYAIVIRGDMTGLGLGVYMMRQIIEYARGRGIGEIYGDVLRDNHTMLKLCRALGFETLETAADDPAVRVRLRTR
jgi:acetyltransferase